MLCERCHRREATCHIVEMAVGVEQVRDFCADCAESSASPELRSILDQTKDAKCEFCGRSPAGTSADMFALMSAVSRLRHMCLECSQEYHRFVLRSLSGVNPNLSQAEQLNVLTKMATEADSHMRNWTKRRKA